VLNAIEKLTTDLPYIVYSSILIKAISINTDVGIEILKIFQSKAIFIKQTEFNTVLAKLASEGRDTEVDSYFSEMYSKGVSPNKATFAILFKLRSKSKDPKAVLSILNKMIHASILPSVNQLQTAVNICKDSGASVATIAKLETYVQAAGSSDATLRALLKNQSALNLT